jgi:hypothetical protein
LYLVEPSNTVKLQKKIVGHPPSYETIEHETGQMIISVVQLSAMAEE